MSDFETIPEHVQSKIDGIPENDVRRRLELDLGKLAIVSNPNHPEDGSEYLPEFVEDRARVHKHMDRIVSVTREAALAIKEKYGYIADFHVRDEAFSLLRSRALEAKSRGDRQASTDYVADLLLIDLLDRQYKTTDRDSAAKGSVSSLVMDGMGEEIVEASRQTHGLVAIEEHGERNGRYGTYYEAESLSSSVRPQLRIVELALGREVSLDPKELALGQKLDRKSSEHELGVMTYFECAAVAAGAKHAQPEGAPADKEFIRQCINKAMDKLAEDVDVEANPYTTLDQDELTLSLKAISNAEPGLLEDESNFAKHFLALRERRRVTASYRINDQGVYPIDYGLVELWADGHEAIAKRLLTAGNELREQDESGRFTDGVLSDRLDTVLKNDPRKNQIGLAIKQEVDRNRQIYLDKMASIIDPYIFHPTDEQEEPRFGTPEYSLFYSLKRLTSESILDLVSDPAEYVQLLETNISLLVAHLGKVGSYVERQLISRDLVKHPEMMGSLMTLLNHPEADRLLKTISVLAFIEGLGDGRRDWHEKLELLLSPSGIELVHDEVLGIAFVTTLNAYRLDRAVASVEMFAREDVRMGIVHPNAKKALLQSIQLDEHATIGNEAIAAMIDPGIQQLMESEDFDTLAIARKVISDPTCVNSLVLIFNRPDLVEKLKQSDDLFELAISQPEGFAKFIDTIQASELSFLSEPNQASGAFMRLIYQSGQVELLTLASPKYVRDLYNRAKHSVDGVQIRYFTDRLSSLTAQLQQISSNPQVEAVLRRLHRDERVLKADEVRLVRGLRSLVFFPSDGNTYESISSVDEVEHVLLSKLFSFTGVEVDTSDESTMRFFKSFESISPLVIYLSQFAGQPEYRTMIGTIVRNIADGTYEQWRVGDGSQEALTEMVEVGYLPRNLTLGQYQQWIRTSTHSTEASIQADAHVTAQTIRQSIENASVDISFLSADASLESGRLSTIAEETRILGPLLGAVHRIEKQFTKGELSSIDAIALIKKEADKLSPSEFRNYLLSIQTPVQIESLPQLVEAEKERLKTIQLLIRLANISPEEVVQGKLLSEEGKPQKELGDVLYDLEVRLGPELKFLLDSIDDIFENFRTSGEGRGVYSVEDTIDPSITIEIGSVPTSTCQHYEIGGYNRGLLGFFEPHVKIILVRNQQGNPVARSVLRLMEDEQGNPVLYRESDYVASDGGIAKQLMNEQSQRIADSLGTRVVRFLEPRPTLTVRQIRAPGVYTDSGGGVHTGSLAIQG